MTEQEPKEIQVPLRNYRRIKELEGEITRLEATIKKQDIRIFWLLQNQSGGTADWKLLQELEKLKLENEALKKAFD